MADSDQVQCHLCKQWLPRLGPKGLCNSCQQAMDKGTDNPANWSPPGEGKAHDPKDWQRRPSRKDKKND